MVLKQRLYDAQWSVAWIVWDTSKKNTFNGVQNVPKQRPHRIYVLFFVVEPGLGLGLWVTRQAKFATTTSGPHVVDW
jgi:hypothetical protein